MIFYSESAIEGDSCLARTHRQGLGSCLLKNGKRATYSYRMFMPCDEYRRCRFHGNGYNATSGDG